MYTYSTIKTNEKNNLVKNKDSIFTLKGDFERKKYYNTTFLRTDKGYFGHF